MKIIVDADACPVKKEIVDIAKEFNLAVIMVMDTSHTFEDGYSDVIIVDKARDSADFTVVNLISKGDIVITQDYGVATMTLARGGYAMNQDGLIYDKDNIDQLLFQRHLSGKVRRAGGKTSGPKKRDKDSNTKFKEDFKAVCMKLIKE